MADKFPSDFYVTCATVIPVLFLAVAVQGQFYDSILRLSLRSFWREARESALKEGRKPPNRVLQWGANLLPTVAFLMLFAAAGGEYASLLALYDHSEGGSQRLFVLCSTLALLVFALAGPGVTYIRTAREDRPSFQGESARRPKA